MSSDAKMILIVVGSTNPVKISAVEVAFRTILPREKIKVIGAKVPSNVSEMPMSRDETIQGALNRAKNAMKTQKNADLSVGIEGGLEHHQLTRWVLRAWVVILEKKTMIPYFGSTVGMWLPDSLIQYMKTQQVDLATAIHQILGIKNVGRTTGVYGLLSNLLVDRKKAFIDALHAAAWPLYNRRLKNQLEKLTKE